MDPSPSILVMGLFLIIAGVLIVHFHNIWIYNWRGFITLLGWSGAIGGMLLLISPILYSHFEFWLKSSDMMIAFGLSGIIMGLCFGYYGFIDKTRSV